MKKVTVRDAISANVFAAILLIVLACVWSASALVKMSGARILAPSQQSVAETLYKVGRYDLLRETAVDCENTFNQVAVAAIHGQSKADWTAAIISLCAFAMLIFNAVFLRGVRRDMEASSVHPLAPLR